MAFGDVVEAWLDFDFAGGLVRFDALGAFLDLDFAADLRDFDFVEDFLVFTIALLLQKEPASLWKVDAFTGLQGSGAKDMRTNERDAFIAD